MIEGFVDGDFLIGSDGKTITIRATLDTGFNDRLTLPFALISELKCPYLSHAEGITAGSGEIDSSYYGATLFWDGETVKIPAIAVEGKPLVGTLLFRGYELRFVSEIGELVTLRKPRPRRSRAGGRE